MTNEEILRALADGKEVQVLFDDNWTTMSTESVLRRVLNRVTQPCMQRLSSFRIKPDVKPDVVMAAKIVKTSPFAPKVSASCVGTQLPESATWGYNVIMVFDGESQELKSIQMTGKPSPSKMEALLYTLLDQLTSDSYRALAQSIQVVLDL